jgi:hypothetical protein
MQTTAADREELSRPADDGCPNTAGETATHDPSDPWLTSGERLTCKTDVSE